MQKKKNLPICSLFHKFHHIPCLQSFFSFEGSNSLERTLQFYPKTYMFSTEAESEVFKIFMVFSQPLPTSFPLLTVYLQHPSQFWMHVVYY